MNASNDQILAIARLARHAPNEWQDFLVQFRGYVDARKSECVMSPPAELFAMQGRAQQAAALLTIFETANKQAGRIETRRP